MTNDLNIIFCPPNKLFYFPCAMLCEYYREKSQEALIVINPSKLNEASSVYEYFVSEEGVFEKIQVFSKVNLVFFHHNLESFYSAFKKIVVSVLQFKDSKDVLVSFYPDGFGGIMHGESFPRKLKEEEGVVVNVKEYFSFGYVHDTVRRQAAGCSVTCLPFSILAALFDKSDRIKAVANLANYPDLTDRQLVLVPYRPWCTKTFHGGMYNFGSQEQLLGVYKALVKQLIGECSSSEVLLLFRPDERFMQESKFVMDGLSQVWPLLCLDDFFPQSLILEPLIYYLFTQKFVTRMSLLCLDSTSFQVPVLLLAHALRSEKIAKNIRFDALNGVGDEVKQMDGGEEFVDRKLKGKMGDFYKRYSAFHSDGYINVIEKLSDTLLKVGIDCSKSRVHL